MLAMNKVKWGVIEAPESVKNLSELLNALPIAATSVYTGCLMPTGPKNEIIQLKDISDFHDNLSDGSVSDTSPLRYFVDSEGEAVTNFPSLVVKIGGVEAAMNHSGYPDYVVIVATEKTTFIDNYETLHSSLEIPMILYDGSNLEEVKLFITKHTKG
jgi:hypothetical protein